MTNFTEIPFFNYFKRSEEKFKTKMKMSHILLIKNDSNIKDQAGSKCPIQTIKFKA